MIIKHDSATIKIQFLNKIAKKFGYTSFSHLRVYGSIENIIKCQKEAIERLSEMYIKELDRQKQYD